MTMTINYLDEKNTRFKRTEGGFLSMRTGRARPIQRVHLYRVFPLSEPSHLISVRDEKDNEIGIIDRLEVFPPETVEMISEELDRRYYSPSIKKLVTLKEEFGYTYWDAESDAGFCRFTVKGGGNNVFQVKENTLMIIDVDGNRFVYPNFEKTDPKYLKIIDTLL